MSTTLLKFREQLENSGTRSSLGIDLTDEQTRSILADEASIESLYRDWLVKLALEGGSKSQMPSSNRTARSAALHPLRWTIAGSALIIASVVIGAYSIAQYQVALSLTKDTAVMQSTMDGE